MGDGALSQGLLALSVVTALMTFAIILFFDRTLRSVKKASSNYQKFAGVVNFSGDFIAVVGLDRRLQYLNPAGRQMLGIPELADYSHVETRNFYTPENNLRVKNELIPYILQNGLWKGDYSYIHQVTGETIPIFMNLFTLHDSLTGEHNGYAVVSRDVRDVKQLEKTFQRFYDLSADLFGIAKSDKHFVKTNTAFTQVLGYSEQELCAAPYTDFMHPDDLLPTQEGIQRQNAQEMSIRSLENRYRTKDGDYRWLSWRFVPDGEYTYASARDVTEEKSKITLMQKLSADAIAASKAKSDFLANMSHEIRTPINGVIGITQLLLDTSLDSEQRNFADTIQRSADSLLSLINDILDFSKVEAGKMDLEMIDYDLGDVLRDTVQTMKFGAEARDLYLNLEVPQTDSLVVRGDPGRVRQVLNNLVSNAIKFTKVGGVTLKVSQAPAERGHKFTFEIVDTGLGIPDEALSRLFKAFEQVDASTSRKFGGTGLGLSICHKLVELMGGKIGVRSQLGMGSTFWFELLLEAGEPEKALTSARQTSAAASWPARLLIVDDNATNLLVASRFAEKAGYRAHCVGSGSEALAALRESDFDIILMDCQMPELDGLAATRLIRASKTLRFPQIPVIALTASAMAEEKQACLDAGMNDHLTKPFRLAALVEKIEKWIPRQPLARDIAIKEASCEKAPSIDLSVFRQFGEGKNADSFVIQLISSFLRAAPPHVKRLTEALVAKDLKGARQVAHTLRPPSLQLGGGKLARKFMALEALKGEALDAAGCKLVGEILLEIADVLTELAAELRRRTPSVSVA